MCKMCKYGVAVAPASEYVVLISIYKPWLVLLTVNGRKGNLVHGRHRTAQTDRLTKTTLSSFPLKRHIILSFVVCMSYN